VYLHVGQTENIVISVFCRKVYKMFTSIFTITTHPARVVIPETFAKKVRNWLGNKEELFNSVKKQVTLDRFIKVNYGKKQSN
jgi:hypothetical protein